METYRLALLRKEFAFLDQLFVNDKNEVTLWPEEVDKIDIQKGDVNLLSETGYEESYGWSDGGHYSYRIFFAICGEDITELKSSGYSGYNGQGNNWEADNIGEQLFALRISPDYIIKCIKNDHDDNGNGPISRFWTIYKMPGFNLSGYYSDRIDEAARILKAEIAAACK